MPNFGDYETVGEPLAVINLQGHSSTVWKVQKHGAPTGAGVQWVVKCYSPHRKSQAGEGEVSLKHDLGLEFLEGIKQLKKVQSEGGRHLTAIHALGISSEGVWYVTDYFPRGSLQALIGRRAKVDGAALKQIIRCIVAGCLVLKRSRGYAHGNLKASNVFLVGKPQTLPKTPMVLADPYPAAPLQLAQLEAADRLEVDELLHQVMEVQDLHALGEIILQLVERRQIRSGYDYNYPISRSELWDSLGKDGEPWRQICNQLLDPQLSLGETNFESLARKFPAPTSGNTLRVATSVLLAIGLAGGGVYGYRVYSAKNQQQAQEQNFKASVAAAQNDLSQNDLGGAKEKTEAALKLEPQDAASVALNNTVATAIRQATAQLNNEVAAGNTAEQNQRWSEAVTNFAGVVTLAKALREEQQCQSAQTEEGFSQAMAAGTAALTSDPSNAEVQARLALGQKQDNLAASNLLSQATAAEAQAQSAATVEQQREALQTAMGSGQTAEQQQHWSEAVTNFSQAATLAQALGDRPSGQQAASEQQYSQLLSDGEAALQSNQAQAAGDKAAAAMKLTVADTSAAVDLQKRAENKAKELANQTKQAKLKADLNAKMSLGQQAEKQAHWSEAVTDFGAAAEAAKALDDSAQVQLAANEQQYSQLLRDGEAALQSNQAQVAGDKAAAAMKLDVADISAAGDLQQRAENKLTELANQTKRQQFNAKMSSGHQAEKQADWTEAVTDFSAAADLAKALDDSAQAQNAVSEQQYSQLLNDGEAALQNNDPQQAGEKAADAIKLAVADASAAVDLQKQADEKATEIANQAKLAKLAAAVDAKMSLGRQAESQGKWSDAVPNFGDAAILAQGLPNSQQVKSAQTEEAFSQAMAAGTRFLANDPANARAQAQLALAQKPDDPEATTLARKAQEAIDLPTAKNDFKQGNYDEALNLCGKYPGVADFDLLKTTVVVEKTAYEKAKDGFDRGDYSFIDGIAKYQGKKCFSDLLAQARPQQAIFKNLETLLKNPSNWGQVNSVLNDPSTADCVKKPGFDQFRSWRQQNDPAVALGKQLALFEVWFSIKDNGDKSVLDPSSKQPAEKFPSGVVPQSYFTYLDNLKTSFSNLGGDQSVHLKEIEKIRDKMVNWDQ